MKLPNRQNLVVLLIALMLLVTSTLLILYLVGEYRTGLRREALFASRDFDKTPFALTDAVTACQFEAGEEYGDRLLQAHFDPLSYRYNERHQTHWVFMRAVIGGTDSQSEIMIFCDVDPRQHIVTYYRSGFLDRDEMLKQRKSLFK